MKKKVLSVLLCTAMAATIAAGCGSDFSRRQRQITLQKQMMQKRRRYAL